MPQNPNVGIIGGGLVGSLCACYFANKNWNVMLFEKRDDVRKDALESGKSINLALSNRGRNALKGVGLEKEVLKNAVPMKGRLLHDGKGKTEYLPYDVVNKQCLYSINRNSLNKILLNGKYQLEFCCELISLKIVAVNNKPNVKLEFKHELVSVDFQTGEIHVKNFSPNNEIKIIKFDLIIGADGAHSDLREQMSRQSLFSYSQKYIDHGYVELQINSSKGHSMTPNFLHIWPRGNFMMIALPNWDLSWTVTLFMPFKKFESLVTAEHILSFFEETFPDSIDLIGEQQLQMMMRQLKPRSLISVKCSPFHYGDKFVLIGDAAHAMVPFYGQGMNAGFEDCFLLDNILSKNDDNIERAIKEFDEIRKNDAHAICEMAMYNYMEMRDLVTRDSYRLRKKLDEFLYRLFPNNWIPLYVSVSFTNIGYKDCLNNRKWQDKILNVIVVFVAASFVVMGTLLMQVL